MTSNWELPFIINDITRQKFNVLSLYDQNQAHKSTLYNKTGKREKKKPS